MGKIKYGARLLRFELQQREARTVAMQEVADAIKMDRSRLNKIELGMVKEVRPEELAALCGFYTERLGRAVDTNEIIGYESANNKKAFGQPALAGF